MQSALNTNKQLKKLEAKLRKLKMLKK